MTESETLATHRAPKSSKPAKKNRTPCTTCQRLRKRCDDSKGYPCKGCKHKGRLCLRAIKKPRIQPCSDASLASGQSESVQSAITARAPIYEPHTTSTKDLPGNIVGSIVNNSDAQTYPILQDYPQLQPPMQLFGGGGSVATYFQAGGPLANENTLPLNVTMDSSYVQTNQGFESYRAEHPTLGGTYSHNAIQVHNAERSHPLAQGMPSTTYNAQESCFNQSSFDFGMAPLPGFE